MDYFTMAKDYYRDAEKIRETMRKYERQLDSCSKKNLEKLNSTIAAYRYIYYDLINTAKELEKRGIKIHNAA